MNLEPIRRRYLHFSTGLVLRVAVLVLVNLGLVYLRPYYPGAWFWVLISGMNIPLVRSLYLYVTRINRKLIRFFESVRFQDFAIKFRSDENLGASFAGLNRQMNQVLEAFRQVREENEANLHFIRTLVQHVRVGIFSMDTAGGIELINREALRLLGIYRLKNLAELSDTPHASLLRLLESGKQRKKFLHTSSDGSRLLIHALTTKVRGRTIWLVSLQNIQSELQQNEQEAWQNLTRVLRHEIMNSVTPIVSLAGTMREIVNQDLPSSGATEGPVADLNLALDTIEQRGRGIMQFVQAYREFTSIPQPAIQPTAVAPMLHRVLTLFQERFQEKGIRLEQDIRPNDLTILLDPSQIEMVLINLIKNACEALDGAPEPSIAVSAGMRSGLPVITVSDNGPGIPSDYLEKVFMPFFSTKKEGSGIGLSLSRQIMHLHGGDIRAFSLPGKGCRMELTFML